MADPRVHDEHDWLRARLDAYVLDLLDEDEQRRFLEHTRVCERCAEAMNAHRENAPVGGPDSHIPAHIIARWDRASRRLRGLPRQLVREHLAHCEACRQELEALGFGSTLTPEPVLEAAPGGPGGGYVMDAIPRATALPSTLRGGPGAEVAVVVGPGQRFVPLSLPDLDLPDSTGLRVTLRDAGGEVRMEQRLRYDELSAGRTLLVGDPRAAFAPGSYTLEVAPAEGAGNPPMEFRLRVEHATAR